MGSLGKSFALILIVLFVVLISPQTIKADSIGGIASEQGSFRILSPLNTTYSTSALTLKIVFTDYNLQYTFECFVDGKFQGDAPYIFNDSIYLLQYAANASMNLPLLSEGSHILKVVMYSSAPQEDTATVYFTVAPASSASVNPTPAVSESPTPSLSPTVPEFPTLLILPLLLSLFSVAVVLRHRKTAK
jgi:hypothetical protein